MRTLRSSIFTGLACFALTGTIGKATQVIATTNQGDVLQYNTATGSYTLLATNPAVLWGVGYSSRGVLYANDSENAPNTGFYSVNADTGTLTSLGVVNGSSISGTGTLTAPVSGGTLYYLDHSNDLYTLNPSTGAATTVGATGISVAGSWDLSFAPNGNLYAAVNENFYRINPITGVGTFIGATGQQIQGLIAGDGGLYGFAGLSMYSIDLATGALTFVRDTPSALGDFDAGAEVLTPTTTSPEPASAFLLPFGFALVCGLLRRCLKTCEGR
jgi:hypothetical protein